MTRALVNEVKTFIEVYNNDYDKSEITHLFSVYQDLNIEFIQDEILIITYDERWFSPRQNTKKRLNQVLLLVDFGLILQIIKN